MNIIHFEFAKCPPHKALCIYVSLDATLLKKTHWSFLPFKTNWQLLNQRQFLMNQLTRGIKFENISVEIYFVIFLSQIHLL